jgi:hypothetical protein
MRAAALTAAGCAWLLAGTAWAQRPSDEDIFGGGEGASAGATTGTGTTTATATATTTSASTTTRTETGGGGKADARDALNLGNPDAATRFSSEVAPADPLKIGGQLYWRVMSTGLQGSKPQDWGMSAPALVDVYMDARPNDRVRGFVLGRMFYDPTLPASGSSSSGTTSSAQSLDFLGSSTATRGPTVLLDQLWLRADILHTIFVTAGKQHVRWGTARFWTPTDYLHMVPRNPLLPFDARTGTTMLKLHLPWEALGWNLYGYLLPNGPETAPTSSSVNGVNVDNGFKVTDVTAAGRAEIVLGTLEIGLGAFKQRHNKAKFAGDLSFGLWDLDFYGEAAVRSAADVDLVTFDQDALVTDGMTAQSIIDAYFPVHRGSRWKTQATGGVSYTHQYADKDTFTIGAEYFYNGLGYSDPKAYPGVLFLHGTSLQNPATFFYLGRQYVGVYATAPAPYSWDNTTFTLSTLANLTDKSGISRLDYSLVVLTHLRFEAYGAVHWGQRNGEFRFGIDGSAFADSNVQLVKDMADRLTRQPAIFDLGVGLRVAL